MEHKSYNLKLRITSLVVAVAFIFTTIWQDFAWAYQPNKGALNRPLASGNFADTHLDTEKNNILNNFWLMAKIYKAILERDTSISLVDLDESKWEYDPVTKKLIYRLDKGLLVVNLSDPQRPAVSIEPVKDKEKKGPAEVAVKPSQKSTQPKPVKKEPATITNDKTKGLDEKFNSARFDISIKSWKTAVNKYKEWFDELKNRNELDKNIDKVDAMRTHCYLAYTNILLEGRSVNRAGRGLDTLDSIWRAIQRLKDAGEAINLEAIAEKSDMKSTQLSAWLRNNKINIELLAGQDVEGYDKTLKKFKEALIELLKAEHSLNIEDIKKAIRKKFKVNIKDDKFSDYLKACLNERLIVENEKKGNGFYRLYGDLPSFTKNEEIVLGARSLGWTYRQIAAYMKIKPDTVKDHYAKSINKKFGTHSIEDALAKALALGIHIEVPEETPPIPVVDKKEKKIKEPIDPSSIELSKIEKEVLKGVRDGHSYRQIAASIGKSFYTVKDYYTDMIKKKLSATDMKDAVQLAMQFDLLIDEEEASPTPDETSNILQETQIQPISPPRPEFLNGPTFSKPALSYKVLALGWLKEDNLHLVNRLVEREAINLKEKDLKIFFDTIAYFNKYFPTIKWDQIKWRIVEGSNGLEFFNAKENTLIIDLKAFDNKSLFSVNLKTGFDHIILKQIFSDSITPGIEEIIVTLNYAQRFREYLLKEQRDMLDFLFLHPELDVFNFSNILFYGLSPDRRKELLSRLETSYEGYEKAKSLTEGNLTYYRERLDSLRKLISIKYDYDSLINQVIDYIRGLDKEGKPVYPDAIYKELAFKGANERSLDDIKKDLSMFIRIKKEKPEEVQVPFSEEELKKIARLLPDPSLGIIDDGILGNIWQDLDDSLKIIINKRILFNPRENLANRRNAAIYLDSWIMNEKERKAILQSLSRFLYVSNAKLRKDALSILSEFRCKESARIVIDFFTKCKDDNNLTLLTVKSLCKITLQSNRKEIIKENLEDFAEILGYILNEINYLIDELTVMNDKLETISAQKSISLDDKKTLINLTKTIPTTIKNLDIKSTLLESLMNIVYMYNLKEFQPFLIEILQDNRSPFLVDLAAKTLQRIGINEKDIKNLKDIALAQKDIFQAQAAVQALGGADSPRAVEALVEIALTTDTAKSFIHFRALEALHILINRGLVARWAREGKIKSSLYICLLKIFDKQIELKVAKRSIALKFEEEEKEEDVEVMDIPELLGRLVGILYSSPLENKDEIINEGISKATFDKLGDQNFKSRNLVNILDADGKMHSRSTDELVSWPLNKPATITKQKDDNVIRSSFLMGLTRRLKLTQLRELSKDPKNPLKAILDKLFIELDSSSSLIGSLEHWMALLEIGQMSYDRDFLKNILDIIEESSNKPILENIKNSKLATFLWLVRLMQISYQAKLDQWSTVEYDRRRDLLQEYMDKTVVAPKRYFRKGVLGLTVLDERIYIPDTAPIDRPSITDVIDTFSHELEHLVSESENIEDISLVGASMNYSIYFDSFLLGTPLNIEAIEHFMSSNIFIELKKFRTTKKITERKKFRTEFFNKGISLADEDMSPKEVFCKIFGLKKELPWKEGVELRRSQVPVEEITAATLRGERETIISTYKEGMMLAGYLLRLAVKAGYVEAWSIMAEEIAKFKSHPAKAVYVMEVIAYLLNDSNKDKVREIIQEIQKLAIQGLKESENFLPYNNLEGFPYERLKTETIKEIRKILYEGAPYEDKKALTKDEVAKIKSLPSFLQEKIVIILHREGYRSYTQIEKWAIQKIFDFFKEAAKTEDVTDEMLTLEAIKEVANLKFESLMEGLKEKSKLKEMAGTIITEITKGNNPRQGMVPTAELSMKESRSSHLQAFITDPAYKATDQEVEANKTNRQLALLGQLEGQKKPEGTKITGIDIAGNNVNIVIHNKLLSQIKLLYPNLSEKETIQQFIQDSIKARAPNYKELYQNIQQDKTLYFDLLDESPTPFGNDRNDGYIYVNKIIFDKFTDNRKPSTKNRLLRTSLMLGISHELRHEAGETDEEKLTEEDVKMVMGLLNKAEINLLIDTLKEIVDIDGFLELLILENDINILENEINGMDEEKKPCLLSLISLTGQLNRAFIPELYRLLRDKDIKEILGITDLIRFVNQDKEEFNNRLGLKNTLEIILKTSKGMIDNKKQFSYLIRLVDILREREHCRVSGNKETVKVFNKNIGSLSYIFELDETLNTKEDLTIRYLHNKEFCNTIDKWFGNLDVDAPLRYYEELVRYLDFAFRYGTGNIPHWLTIERRISNILNSKDIHRYQKAEHILKFAVVRFIQLPKFDAYLKSIEQPEIEYLRGMKYIRLLYRQTRPLINDDKKEEDDAIKEADEDIKENILGLLNSTFLDEKDPKRLQSEISEDIRKELRESIKRISTSFDRLSDDVVSAVKSNSYDFTKIDAWFNQLRFLKKRFENSLNKAKGAVEFDFLLSETDNKIIYYYERLINIFENYINLYQGQPITNMEIIDLNKFLRFGIKKGKFATEEEISLLTNRTMLDLLFESLEENAMSAMKEPEQGIPEESRKVDIHISNDNGNTTITFKNPGKLPQELLELDELTRVKKIFLPKYTKDTPDLNVRERGLVFIYELVKALGGQIDAENIDIDGQAQAVITLRFIDVKAKITEANRLFCSGKTEQALAIYKNIISVNPSIVPKIVKANIMCIITTERKDLLNNAVKILKKLGDPLNDFDREMIRISRNKDYKVLGFIEGVSDLIKRDDITDERKTKRVGAARGVLLNYLELLGIKDENLIEDLQTIEGELAINIVIHANYGLIAIKEIKEASSKTAGLASFEIKCIDNGNGIPKEKIEDVKKIIKEPDARAKVGRGFFFIAHFASKLDINSEVGQGTEITVIKKQMPQPPLIGETGNSITKPASRKDKTDLSEIKKDIDKEGFRDEKLSLFDIEGLREEEIRFRIDNLLLNELAKLGVTDIRTFLIYLKKVISIRGPDRFLGLNFNKPIYISITDPSYQAPFGDCLKNDIIFINKKFLEDLLELNLTQEDLPKIIFPILALNISHQLCHKGTPQEDQRYDKIEDFEAMLTDEDMEVLIRLGVDRELIYNTLSKITKGRLLERLETIETFSAKEVEKEINLIAEMLSEIDREAVKKESPDEKDFSEVAHAFRHDICNPMNAITNFAKLIKRSYPNEIAIYRHRLDSLLEFCFYFNNILERVEEICHDEDIDIEKRWQLLQLFMKYLLSLKDTKLLSEKTYKDIRDHFDQNKEIQNQINFISISLGRFFNAAERYLDMTGKYNFTRVNLHNFIEDIKALSNELKDRHGKPNIGIDFVEEGLPEIIEIDASKLRIVFQNLIDNALSFTEDSGRITVGLRRFDNEKIEISISDTGKGIPPEIIPQLFKKGFSHRTEEEKKLGAGSGIGLWLCERMIVRHKGTIEAENIIEKAGEKGVVKGTRFIILLPINQTPAKEKEEKIIPSAQEVVEPKAEDDHKAMEAVLKDEFVSKKAKAKELKFSIDENGRFSISDFDYEFEFIKSLGFWERYFFGDLRNAIGKRERVMTQPNKRAPPQGEFILRLDPTQREPFGNNKKDSVITVNPNAFTKSKLSPWAKRILFLVGFTHELLGHEVGFDDEDVLTQEDVQLVIALIPKGHTLNEFIIEASKVLDEKKSGILEALKGQLKKLKPTTTKDTRDLIRKTLLSQKDLYKSGLYKIDELAKNLGLEKTKLEGAVDKLEKERDYFLKDLDEETVKLINELGRYILGYSNSVVRAVFIIKLKEISYKRFPRAYKIKGTYVIKTPEGKDAKYQSFTKEGFKELLLYLKETLQSHRGLKSAGARKFLRNKIDKLYKNEGGMFIGELVDKAYCDFEKKIGEYDKGAIYAECEVGEVPGFSKALDDKRRELEDIKKVTLKKIAQLKEKAIRYQVPLAVLADLADYIKAGLDIKEILEEKVGALELEIKECKMKSLFIQANKLKEQMNEVEEKIEEISEELRWLKELKNKFKDHDQAKAWPGYIKIIKDIFVNNFLMARIAQLENRIAGLREERNRLLNAGIDTGKLDFKLERFMVELNFLYQQLSSSKFKNLLKEQAEVFKELEELKNQKKELEKKRKYLTVSITPITRTQDEIQALKDVEEGIDRKEKEISILEKRYKDYEKELNYKNNNLDLRTASALGKLHNLMTEVLESELELKNNLLSIVETRLSAIEYLRKEFDRLSARNEAEGIKSVLEEKATFRLQKILDQLFGIDEDTFHTKKLKIHSVERTSHLKVIPILLSVLTYINNLEIFSFREDTNGLGGASFFELVCEWAKGQPRFRLKTFEDEGLNRIVEFRLGDRIAIKGIIYKDGQSRINFLDLFVLKEFLWDQVVRLCKDKVPSNFTVKDKLKELEDQKIKYEESYTDKIKEFKELIRGRELEIIEYTVKLELEAEKENRTSHPERSSVIKRLRQGIIVYKRALTRIETPLRQLQAEIAMLKEFNEDLNYDEAMFLMASGIMGLDGINEASIAGAKPFSVTFTTLDTHRIDKYRKKLEEEQPDLEKKEVDELLAKYYCDILITDLDLTLTDIGNILPDEIIMQLVILLYLDKKIAIVTGRNIKSLKEKLSPLFELIERTFNEKEANRIFSNLLLFTNHGARYYRFDRNKKDFIEEIEDYKGYDTLMKQKVDLRKSDLTDTEVRYIYRKLGEIKLNLKELSLKEDELNKVSQELKLEEGKLEGLTLMEIVEDFRCAQTDIWHEEGKDPYWTYKTEIVYKTTNNKILKAIIEELNKQSEKDNMELSATMTYLGTIGILKKGVDKENVVLFLKYKGLFRKALGLDDQACQGGSGYKLLKRLEEIGSLAFSVGDVDENGKHKPIHHAAASRHILDEFLKSITKIEGVNINGVRDTLSKNLSEIRKEENLFLDNIDKIKNKFRDAFTIGEVVELDYTDYIIETIKKPLSYAQLFYLLHLLNDSNERMSLMAEKWLWFYIASFIDNPRLRQDLERQKINLLNIIDRYWAEYGFDITRQKDKELLMLEEMIVAKIADEFRIPKGIFWTEYNKVCLNRPTFIMIRIPEDLLDEERLEIQMETNLYGMVKMRKLVPWDKRDDRYFAYIVPGKKGILECDKLYYTKSDGLTEQLEVGKIGIEITDTPSRPSLTGKNPLTLAVRMEKLVKNLTQNHLIKLILEKQREDGINDTYDKVLQDLFSLLYSKDIAIREGVEEVIDKVYSLSNEEVIQKVYYIKVNDSANSLDKDGIFEQFRKSCGISKEEKTHTVRELIEKSQAGQNYTIYQLLNMTIGMAYSALGNEKFKFDELTSFDTWNKLEDGLLLLRAMATESTYGPKGETVTLLDISEDNEGITETETMPSEGADSIREDQNQIPQLPKDEGTEKTYHLPLYLWKAIRDRLKEEYKKGNLSKDEFYRIKNIGLARLENGQILFEDDRILEYALQEINRVLGRAPPKPDEPLSYLKAPIGLDELKEYIRSHEKIQLLISSRTDLIEKIKNELEKGAYKDLKVAFQRNYGIYSSQPGEKLEQRIAEEIFTTYVAERINLNQTLRLLENKRYPRYSRFDLPAQISALFDEVYKEITGRNIEEDVKKPSFSKGPLSEANEEDILNLFNKDNLVNILLDRNHVIRVTKIADIIARRLGLEEKDIKILRLACLSHDLGYNYVNYDDLIKLATLARKYGLSFGEKTELVDKLYAMGEDVRQQITPQMEEVMWASKDHPKDSIQILQARGYELTDEVVIPILYHKDVDRIPSNIDPKIKLLAMILKTADTIESSNNSAKLKVVYGVELANAEEFYSGTMHFLGKKLNKGQINQELLDMVDDMFKKEDKDFIEVLNEARESKRLLPNYNKSDDVESLKKAIKSSIQRFTDDISSEPSQPSVTSSQRTIDTHM